MTKVFRYQLVFCALLAVYVAYLFGLASLAHVVTNEILSAAVTEFMWYSLTCAALAVGCWIALGDGSGLIRSLVGSWSLVSLWIVWQTSIYTYAMFEPGNAGSTAEGFTIYATGNAITGLVATILLVGTARVTMGLRLVREPALGPLIPSRQRFTLPELLCLVAICATTLGAARLVAPQDMGYVTWFMKLDNILNFVWIWAYTVLIAVPTALVLVHPRKLLLAACYFLVAITVLVVHQRWQSISRISFTGWRFFWLLEILRMGHVVAHVAAIQLLMKCLGYSLTWRLRVQRS